MTVIEARTTDQVLSAVILPKIAPNNHNSVKLSVTFDDYWNGYGKSAIFFTEDNKTPYEVVFSADNTCFVPQEVLVDSGHLFITIKGVKSDGAVKTSLSLRVKISKGTPCVVVSAPTDDVYNRLLAAYGNTNEVLKRAIAVERARIDSIESGGTAEGDEVVGIRSGANGLRYSNAGTAVREQFDEKLDKIENAHVDYEIGNVSISASGWDYNDDYSASGVSVQSARVRTKEGAENRLVAGDIIGLTDYTNARFFVGYRDDEGTYYYSSGWLTSDFTCPTEADYIILVARPEGKEVIQNDAYDLGSLIRVQRIDGVANVAENQSDIVAAALDVDLNFVLGSANADGFLNYESRYVTKDILHLDIDIMLKRMPDKYRMAVHTYTDANGTGYRDLGWVTDKGDYIITAGTYFRVLAMPKDYEVAKALIIDPAKQYETDLYKSLEIYPAVGKKINLLKTARTLARIEARNSQRKDTKQSTIPLRVKSINHRGYNYLAPENTLPAYKLSKKNGFDFVECDLRWTSDHMPVLLHDVSINRTARTADGKEIAQTVNIADIDYSTALTYDFCGSLTAYSGTKIPTFEEFIALCRNIQLHPYIEIEEEIFEWQAIILMDIVRKYGMENNVTWISFTHNSLLRIIEQNPRSRVGYLRMATHTEVEKELHMTGLLKTDFNEVFLNLAYDNGSLDDYVDKAFELEIPVEVWCPYTKDEILALPSYISGITTDKLIAHDVLYNAFIN